MNIHFFREFKISAKDVKEEQDYDLKDIKNMETPSREPQKNETKVQSERN